MRWWAQLSFYGAVPEGQASPERRRSLYSARMPEERTVTFKRAFERRLEIVERTLAPDATKLMLCDGHRALWNYVDRR